MRRPGARPGSATVSKKVGSLGPACFARPDSSTSVHAAKILFLCSLTITSAPPENREQGTIRAAPCHLHV